jgi:hypothetical protein
MRNRHDWVDVHSSPTIIEQRCDRCQLGRWQTRGAESWWYNDDATGRWSAHDYEPFCWPEAA